MFTIVSYKLVRNIVFCSNVWLKAILMLFAFHFSFSPAFAQSWTADNGNGTFTNPLFYDEFSDPDILRVGDDYYLAGTTMHTVPTPMPIRAVFRVLFR